MYLEKTSDEQMKARTEMRQRMMLCIIDEKCWFETEVNQDNEDDYHLESVDNK